MTLTDSITLLKTLLSGHTPGQLVIQITDHCNARCPQCGMRITQHFKRSRLPADDIKRMLDAAAEQGVQAVSFTGGEPFLMSEVLVDLIRHAGKAGIRYIRTGTNGFMFQRSGQPGFETRISKLAEILAESPLRNFWISIDSADADVHEAMRGLPGVIRGIEKAIPVFHAHGLYPSANLGINRNISGKPIRKLMPSDADHSAKETDRFYREFRSGFRAFFRFVKDMGFTIVNCCYPMSIDTGSDPDELKPVYEATSTGDIVRFSRQEKALVYRALSETLTEFRSGIRIFTPRCSLYRLIQYYADHIETPYPCRGGLDYWFVNSQDGNVYPCGFRGHENHGKLWNRNEIHRPSSSTCTLCDWECFRYPSELFGPLTEALSAPRQLAGRLGRDWPFFRLWLQDLRYYLACDWFDGNKPPEYGKMAAVGGKED